MTTEILGGVYAAAYQVASPVTTISITASGYLAAGLTSAGTGAYTVYNFGVVRNIGGAIILAGVAEQVSNAGTIWDKMTTNGSGVALGGGTIINQYRGVIKGYYGVEFTKAAGSLTNLGKIEAVGAYGAMLFDGGQVTNGSTTATRALIEGKYGVHVSLGGTVHNYATILGLGAKDAGVFISGGGLATNGSATDTTALMAGMYYGVAIVAGPGTVKNFGVVEATASPGVGVMFSAGGSLTNGSAADSSARIQGTRIGVSVRAASGAVTNFGTIASGYGAVNYGVQLTDGGTITNGSTSNTTAELMGSVAALVQAAYGTVKNFATIGGGQAQYGVEFSTGGRVVNGAATDTVALIHGHEAIVLLSAPGSVTNFGTVLADDAGGSFVGAQAGIVLGAGGGVTNGSSTDKAARIEGVYGVYSENAAAVVANFGTIASGGVAVKLAQGGRVTNGYAIDQVATIQGDIYAIRAAAQPLNVTNFGSILAGPIDGCAVYSQLQGTVVNGGTSDATALIEGYVGVSLKSGGPVTNFGTIAGSAVSGSLGVAMNAKGVLTNEVGGLITGSTGVQAGSYATVINFGTIQGVYYSVNLFTVNAQIRAEAGSVFIGQVYAGADLVSVVAGVATMTGLHSSGVISGAGTLSLNGGTSVFGAGVSLSAAEIDVAGAATYVEIATTLSDGKVWKQAGGQLAVDGGDQATFTGAGSRFSGTVSGAGSILLSGGTDTLSNVTITAAKWTINNSAVTFSGAVVIGDTVTATSSSLVIAAGGATLSGAGELLITNSASNSLTGATSTATLTNKTVILAAGTLGGGAMSLVNLGTIKGSGSAGLTIDTGAATLVNKGLIAALTGDVTTIQSAVDNTGALSSTGGTLIVNGAVSGAGLARVAGGVVDFASSFTGPVVFGASGRLTLAHSTGFTGAVSGFSKTGTTSFDLQDIAVATASAKYSGTAASGVLTVTDGTHTAQIHLTGDYTASVWALSADGSGGTIVVDPVKPPAAHAFIAAVAGFAPGPAGPATAIAPAWTAPPRLLAPSRAQLA